MTRQLSQRVQGDRAVSGSVCVDLSFQASLKL